MAVTTTYDEYREVIRKKLEEALEYARTHILDPDTWGYGEMKDGYAVGVYIAIDTARRSI